MRSFEPFIFVFTYTALLLLLHILIITALPLDPSPVPFSIRSPLVSFPRQTLKPNPPKPSTGNRTTPLIHGRARFYCAEKCCPTGCCRRKEDVTAIHTSLIESSPPKYNRGIESFLIVLNPFRKLFRDRHLDEAEAEAEAEEKEKEEKRMGSNNTTSPAADGGGVGGKKETTRRWMEEGEEEEEDKDVPLIRIFPNGSFSPFTSEETIEFYILRNAQGQGPDVRDPPLEHPAPPGVEQTPKPSKEGSVYDESRTCDSSGEWCKMPVEGSELIAGIGIGSCTYFEPGGIWGKTVTYLAC